MSDRRERGRRLQAVTLALTVVLGVALVGIVYFAVTSLPYLATSPSTDATFGPLNACLLQALPERVGFAVNRDDTRVAAWSTSAVVVCAGSPPAPRRFELPGVTLGTWDFSGGLWLARAPLDGGAASLQHLEDDHFVERGQLAPTAMEGTAHGVLLLDAQGQVLAVGPDGSVLASRQIPLERRVTLVSNATGSLVALFGGGRFAVINTATLASTPAEAPCPVEYVWWRPEEVLLVAQCLDLVVEINALDSRSALLEPRQRTKSVLSGPVYVERCDMLPCTAEAPR